MIASTEVYNAMQVLRRSLAITEDFSDLDVVFFALEQIRSLETALAGAKGKLSILENSGEDEQ